MTGTFLLPILVFSMINSVVGRLGAELDLPNRLGHVGEHCVQLLTSIFANREPLEDFVDEPEMQFHANCGSGIFLNFLIFQDQEAAECLLDRIVCMVTVCRKSLSSGIGVGDFGRFDSIFEKALQMGIEVADGLHVVQTALDVFQICSIQRVSEVAPRGRLRGASTDRELAAGRYATVTNVANAVAFFIVAY
jgi:hypothetical protein